MVRIVAILAKSAIGNAAFWLIAYYLAVPTSKQIAPNLFGDSLFVRTVIILTLLTVFCTSMQSAKRQVFWVSDQIKSWVKYNYFKLRLAFSSAFFLAFIIAVSSSLGLISDTGAMTILVCFVVIAICSAVMAPATQIAKPESALPISKLPKFMKKRIELVDGLEMMKSDPRPPVLFIRSFANEKRTSMATGVVSRWIENFKNSEGVYLFHVPPEFSGKWDNRKSLKKSHLGFKSMWDEQMIFSEFFEFIGPYVSIKRPDELLEDSSFGAASIEPIGLSWKMLVTELMEKAVIIVVEAGNTNSLIWEVEQIVERCKARKLLLILPHRQHEYDEFCRLTHSVFPQPLPHERPKSRLIMFDDYWTPKVLENVNLCVGDTLFPFCVRNGIDWTTRRQSLRDRP